MNCRFKRTAWTAAIVLLGCGDDGPAPADAGSASSVSSTASGGSTSTGGPSTSGTEDAPAPRADLGVEPAAGCSDYCAVSEDCLGADEADCLLTCTAETEDQEDIGPECAGAFAEARACASALNCDDFAEFSAAQGDFPCGDEDAAWRLACTLGNEPPSMSCDAFCTTLAGCDVSDETTCAVSCAETSMSADDVGAECAESREEQLSCATALSCDALEAWLAAEPGNACESADENVAENCVGE